MSTSTAFHARAEIWRLLVMCSAMSLRMCETGTTSSRGPATAAGCGAGAAAGCGAGAAAGGGAAGGGGAAAALRSATYARTSPLVMRPPVPVPTTCDRSTPCSSASRRTSGDRICDLGPRSGRPLAPATDGAAAAPVGVGSSGEAVWGGARGGADSGASPPPRAGAAGAAETPAVCAAPGEAPTPDSSISASGVLTATVWPSGTRIFVSTPAAGEGTSVSTLSVEISNRGSSRATVSPSRLSHLRMVPSTTVSPSWGMVTVVMCPPGSPRSELLDGGLDVGDLRQVGVLEDRGERDGHVRRGETDHRCVEVLESLLGDHG